MKTQQIPPDQSSWGTFPELAERNRAIMKGILEKAAVDNPQRDSIDQQVVAKLREINDGKKSINALVSNGQVFLQ